MPKDIYQFVCPCCSKHLELDTRSGVARARNPAEQKGGTDLDQMLRAQKRDGERLDKVFDAAKERQQKERDLLDGLLEQAKDDAKKNPDEKLRRPWDLE